MFKSVKRFYEHKRSYDLSEAISSKQRKFVKKRARKRSRKQEIALKEYVYNENKD